VWGRLVHPRPPLNAFWRRAPIRPNFDGRLGEGPTLPWRKAVLKALLLDMYAIVCDRCPGPADGYFERSN
jgi:hypothetical protein